MIMIFVNIIFMIIFLYLLKKAFLLLAIRFIKLESKIEKKLEIIENFIKEKKNGN